MLVAHFTLLGFQLNRLLDHGERLDIEEVRRWCRGQDVLASLEARYAELRLSFIKTEHRAPVDEFFFNLDNALDARRKFMVERDGLCLLLAFCFEGIQQCVPVEAAFGLDAPTPDGRELS